MKLTVLRTQPDLAQSNKMKVHGRHLYTFFKTICAVQLGSNLENPYVASPTSLTPPQAAVLMKENMYHNNSFFCKPKSLAWKNSTAQALVHESGIQRSPLTVL